MSDDDVLPRRRLPEAGTLPRAAGIIVLHERLLPQELALLVLAADSRRAQLRRALSRRRRVMTDARRTLDDRA